MYQDHHIQYTSENINFCLLDFCSCEIRNKRLRKNCNTISLSKQCKEQDNCTFVTSEKNSVEWTTKREIIANYVGRQNLLSWDSVKRESSLSESIPYPALSIKRDFLSRINKSSLLELCEENCVGEFHLTEECEEEHCNIAKQVFHLMTDLVKKLCKKCSEFDSRVPLQRKNI